VGSGLDVGRPPRDRLYVVDKLSDRAVAAGASVDAGRWRRVLEQVLESFAGRFGRIEPRRSAAGFVAGLLSQAEVKACWQIAEQAGHQRPDAMQRLLYRSVWDADGARDDLRELIVGRLGHADGVLVADETET